MNAETYSAIGACVSALVAVVGLPLIWLQLRDMRNSAYSQAIASVYDRFVDLDRYLIDNPQYRGLLYAREPPKAPDPNLDPRAEAVAEFVTDVLYQAFNQRNALQAEAFGPETAYMKELFASPLLVSYLSRHRQWYRTEFTDLMLQKAADRKT